MEAKWERQYSLPGRQQEPCTQLKKHEFLAEAIVFDEQAWKSENGYAPMAGIIPGGLLLSRARVRFIPADRK